MKQNLAGTWQFALDRDDVGVSERWFGRELGQTIALPGILQAQGYGDEVTAETQWVGDIIDRSYFTDDRYAPYREPDNIKYPCWLQPDKYYMGAAWYQREVELPAAWAGQRVTLFLERAHWETRVWLDETEVGSDLSLSTPHVYELGTHLTPGRHRLTIRVDNRMLINVGPNAHSMSDHTQGNWNGVVGRLELQAGCPVWLENVQVWPNAADKRPLIALTLHNRTPRPASGTLTLQASTPGHAPAPLTLAVDIPRHGATIHVEYPLGEEALLWDEFSPALYQLECQLTTAAGTAVCTTTFGLRDVATRGTQLTVNGRSIFLRGTLECCIFPRTGYPPTDVAEWQRIIRVCQSYGLNHLRFHSWCPPEAAFIAADEMGFYYQVECASWANQGATIGDGQPLDRWLYAEAERIIAAYGNHPSFLLMAYGNEPSGQMEPFLSNWLRYWRGHDPRRVHTGGAGWPILTENGYENSFLPRIQLWGAELNSRINALPPETTTDYRDWVAKWDRPIISHEIGQWCVYPDFDEIEKYTGHLKAKNFEIFRDFLQANHMGDQARDFLLASGKLQTLCYKEEIESALRTPGFGGFQLLDLHDFPGQGTALVGVVDPFWEPKPYVAPAAFHRFCGATVPLARLGKRVWQVGERLTAVLDIAHYGPRDWHGAEVVWRLEGEAIIAHGTLPAQTLPTGTVTQAGLIEVDLSGLAAPQKLRLVVGIAGSDVENDWELWLFAPALPEIAAPDLHICHALDEAALAHLAQGGNALLLADPATVHAPSVLGFSTVFWNTSWTRGQAPHTLGILCDPTHPVFAHFPTEYHSNWQWWELVHGAQAMVLNGLPPEIRPLVQPIDTWFEARRLGLLFEARVNGGRLMVCTMDLVTDLDNRAVARQFRHSLLRYVASGAFAPEWVVEKTAVLELLNNG